MLERFDGSMMDDELVAVANEALATGDFSQFGEVPFYAVPLAVIAMDFKDGRPNWGGPLVRCYSFEGEEFLALECPAGCFRLHHAVIV